MPVCDLRWFVRTPICVVKCSTDKSSTSVQPVHHDAFISKSWFSTGKKLEEAHGPWQSPECVVINGAKKAKDITLEANWQEAHGPHRSPKKKFAHSYVYTVTFIIREKNHFLRFENIISPRKILRKGRPSLWTNLNSLNKLELRITFDSWCS